MVELEVGHPEVDSEGDSGEAAAEDGQRPVPVLGLPLNVGVTLPVGVAVGEERQEGGVNTPDLR